MNKVQEFIFNNLGSVRIIPSENGNQIDTLFCAKDVASILGYSNTKDAILRHCKGVVKHDLPSNGGNQLTNFIKLPDVFNLIYGSKMPFAEEFKDWISYELLPSIYMNGSYTDQNHDPNFKLPNTIYNSATDTYDLAQNVDSEFEIPWNEETLNQFPECMRRYQQNPNIQLNKHDSMMLYGVNLMMNEYQQRHFEYTINIINQLQNQINQMQQDVNKVKQLIVPVTIEK
jgi:prophage antirepressor-like protein